MKSQSCSTTCDFESIRFKFGAHMPTEQGPRFVLQVLRARRHRQLHGHQRRQGQSHHRQWSSHRTSERDLHRRGLPYRRMALPRCHPTRHHLRAARSRHCPTSRLQFTDKSSLLLPRPQTHRHLEDLQEAEQVWPSFQQLSKRLPSGNHRGRLFTYMCLNNRHYLMTSPQILRGCHLCRDSNLTCSMWWKIETSACSRSSAAHTQSHGLVDIL